MQAPKKIAIAGATGRAGRHAADVLRQRGYDVVPISRSHGVDVITGKGLDAALAGVDCIVDATTGPSPDQQAATEFFETAAHNLQRAGAAGGAQRIVVVSIIGIDKFTAGYSAAKVAHEQAMLEGPVPVHILRASQFHEFIEQLMEWGRQGDVSYLPNWKVQPVAARNVGELLADLATATEAPPQSISEIAGPREEQLVELGRLFVARRGLPLRIEEGSNPDDPDRDLYESGALLPGPYAVLTGPTFEHWLAATSA